MYCRTCGAEMNENQEVCLSCGVPKNIGKGFCPNCGKEVPENATICLGCGISLAAQKKEEPAAASSAAEKKDNKLGGQDKTVMIILALFLGGFGIHNFMMGESKRGITRIVATLLCGIGWILALIDLIKIAMDSYVVDPNALI